MRKIVARIHYVWVRAGLAALVLMPIAMYFTFRPWGVPGEVLESREGVTVAVTNDGIGFQPPTPGRAALMVVPGCPVDPAAYAPLARRVAQEGFAAVVVNVPYRCAPFADAERALDRRILSIAATRADARWVLAGHSRGGAHTARLALSRPAAIAAYVLMGTSHPRTHDLSGLPIDMTKIAATEDGVAGEAQFDRTRLPAGTRWVRIEGGNHSQFGYYGFQLFDHRATITREEQQSQILQALLDVLRRL